MQKRRYVGIFTFVISSLLWAQGGAAPERGQEERRAQDAFQEEQREAELKWHNPDYRPYYDAFDNLVKLSDAYARNKLRLALANYQTARSIIMKMREEVERFKRERAEARYFHEKWYWQVIDRKRQEERIIARMKREAKLKAVTYLSRAINHLDDIKNKRVRESEEFKNLLANVYMHWVINQYDLGNLPQCIDILERYIALDPKFEREVAPHKYLVSAYAFQERLLSKTGKAPEQQILYYKKKKNEHLLRAAELKYGKDSPEYRHIVELVNRDEIIAIAP